MEELTNRKMINEYEITFDEQDSNSQWIRFHIEFWDHTNIFLKVGFQMDITDVVTCIEKCETKRVSQEFMEFIHEGLFGLFDEEEIDEMTLLLNILLYICKKETLIHYLTENYDKQIVFNIKLHKEDESETTIKGSIMESLSLEMSSFHYEKN